MVRYNVDEASMPAGSRFESGVVQGIWFDKDNLESLSNSRGPEKQGNRIALNV